jgi:uncharacterized repeat protein (TIGR02543 family)
MKKTLVLLAISSVFLLIIGCNSDFVSGSTDFHRVSFDSQGGIGDFATEIVKSGDAIILPTPTRPYYIFEGWFNASSEGTKLGKGGDILVVSGSLTMFAQWSNVKISTVEQLIQFRNEVNNGNTFDGRIVVLLNNINLNGIEWRSIGGSANTPFDGTLYGNGNVISGLSSSLFGTLGKNATIKDIGVIVDISRHGSVGGLAHVNYGKIEDSYVRGRVLSSAEFTYTAGLVGRNNNSGNIVRSYFSGNVLTVNARVGGLVGDNLGRIEDCYALGIVDNFFSMFSGIGGLVGSNSGTIVSSYASATIIVPSSTGVNIGGLVGSNTGTVTLSYYDRQTSRRNDTGKGIGRTTAEMRMPNTYVGWDFINIWGIDPNINNGFPYLRKIEAMR